MSRVTNVLSKIINGDDNFCCLCFETVDALCYISDKIIIDDVENEKSQEISVVLRCVFGEEFLDTISSFTSICTSCKKSCALSYKFIKMCKQNYENLNKAIKSVSESVQHTILDVDYYENLYITLNMKDFSSRQYYDTKPLAKLNVSDRLNEIAKTKIKLDNEEDNLDDIPEIPTTEICYVEDPDSFYCKVCKELFFCELKVRTHFFKCHYSRDYQCKLCPRAFLSKELLQQHRRNKHNSRICKECGKYFNNKYVLKKHEMNHNLQVICTDCGRMYRSMEAFNNHKKGKVCGTKSKKSSKDGEYQCDHCKKMYCTKAYLAKHLKYEHGNAEGFRCKFCLKQFYSRSKLDTHIVKHTLEKKFCCDICGGRFGTQMALVYHTRLHTGEKPYSCEYCNEAFISSSRRLEHVRRHHLEPELECDICHSKFKATGSLLRHKKRHSNPKSRLYHGCYKNGMPMVLRT